MSKITVIGSLVMDMVATMPEFPEAGETVLGTDIGFYPGGKGANQCVAIARLGGDVEMVGMLGNDSNGDVFRKIMKDEGIKCDNLLSCDSATAVAQIQINKNVTVVIKQLFFNVSPVPVSVDMVIIFCKKTVFRVSVS